MKNKIILPIFLILFFNASARAATFVVNSIGDGVDANLMDNLCETATAGECTLRAAIGQANQTAGADALRFNIAPFNGAVKTIAPATALPDITEAVTIDGYTQTGAKREHRADERQRRASH